MSDTTPPQTQNRPIFYLGSSRKELQKLPDEVKEIFAHGLYVAAQGGIPLCAKVLKGFGGASVVELKEDHNSDTYRAVYTVKFKEAVYVLHVFKKKSKKGGQTPKKDMSLIQQRLKDATAHHLAYFKKGVK